MENAADLEKIETMLRGRDVKKTKQLYDSIQENPSSSIARPQEIISNLATQLKIIHRAETSKQPPLKRNEIAPKSFRSKFVNINMLLEDEQITPNLKSFGNKFETQSFSDTQLINVIEKVEAINVAHGYTQEFYTSFQGHKDNNCLNMKKEETSDDNTEIDQCMKSESLMDVGDKKYLFNETKDVTNMLMVPNVSHNAENYFDDLEMPSSPILPCSKPLKRNSVPLVFNLESFEKFESIAVPVVEENLNKTATKRRINSQMVDRELFLNINLEPVLFERDKLDSPVISFSSDDIIVKKDEHIHENEELKEYDKRSDSLKDEILFSSDEDEEYTHKNLEELSFTCALENPYFDEPESLDSPTMYVGFQTASDKSIKIYSNSFQNAKNIFSDINLSDNENNSVTELVAKHDSVNKNTIICQESNFSNLNVSKVNFNKCCDNNVNMLDLKPSKGFRTASNKVIKPSDEALSRSLKVFKDINLDEEFSCKETKENEMKDVSRNPRELFSEEDLDILKIEDDCLLQEFENVEMSHSDDNIADNEQSNNKATKEALDNLNSTKTLALKFQGFKTAANTAITVSEKALAKSKKLFDDLNDLEDNVAFFNKTKSSNFASAHFKGFQTASDKQVTVSIKALERSKKMFEGSNNFEGIENIPENSLEKRDDATIFKGFQTASKKPVVLSKAALERSRKIFQDINDGEQIEESCSKNENLGVDKNVGFQTASNKNVEISKAALEKSKKIFQGIDSIVKEDFSSINLPKIMLPKTSGSYSGEQNACFGFKLASNKAVMVSKEALAKSKNIFQDINNVSDVIDKEFSKPQIQGMKASFLRKETTSFAGFQTASNKDVNVSEKAYIERKHLFTDILTGGEQDFETSNSMENKQINSSDNVDIKANHKFQGFRTASNKQINISEATLKESRKIFDDLDLEIGAENKDCKKAFAGFQTASNKKVKVTAEALVKTKAIFEKIDSSIDINAQVNTGALTFQTGYKKEVSGSEDSLKKIRNTTVYKCDEIKTVNLHFKNNRNAKLVEEALNKAREDLDKNPQESKKVQNCYKTDRKCYEVENIIDTQVLNNFDQTLNTEDFCSTPKPVSKKSGSPILSCPKAKRRKLFETPYAKTRHVNKVKPINVVKPTVQNERFIFAANYKKNKKLCLKDIVQLENGKHDMPIDPYILQFEFNDLLKFEFVDNRNDLTDSKVINVENVKSIFLGNVDRKIVQNGWVENHVKFILWKLISYEIKFPKTLGCVCTAKTLVNQLKYRYNRELHNAERPALRKILEKDDVPGKTMVLAVLAVYADGVSVASVPQTYTTIELELTDGWYSIRATIDKMLANLVVDNKIKIGGKLVVNGAELVNCNQGVAPWEDTSAIRLKIFGNSTRRARFDARLGYHGNAAMLTQLSAVKPEGGKVSKIRVFVARVYPTLYVEKFEDGSTVTRSERLENLHQMRYENERQAVMEKIYEAVEKEFSDQADSQDSDIPSGSNKRNMETGSWIAKYMKNCNDPAEFRSNLTDSQLKLLQEHTTKRREKLLQDIQTKVLEKINKDGVGAKRNVVTLVKTRIVGVEERNGEVHISKAMLSIWKPNDAILDMVSEGSWIEVLNVVPTSVRYSEIQMSAGRQSIFKKCSKNIPEHSVHHTKLLQRSCYNIRDVLQNPSSNTDYNEIDTIGMIFLIEPSIKEFDSKKESFQNVYITDADKNFICVNFWGGIKKFGYENLLQTGIIVSCINLQKRAGNSRKNIPQYRVTEYTYFTKTPKDNVARKMVNSLENKFIGVDKCIFCNDCISLKNKYVIAKPNVDNVSPYRFNKSDYNISRNKMFIDSPLTTKVKSDDLNLTGLDFESTFKQETQELSPNTLKRKMKVKERIEKLKRYGEPPPITPMTIINKSKNAASAYKSPLLSRSDGAISVANIEERNIPHHPKSTKDDSQEQSSPILKLNETYVKKSVNPVKLNFNDSAMKENDSVIDHFAEDFDCSPPLSLD